MSVVAPSEPPSNSPNPTPTTDAQGKPARRGTDSHARAYGPGFLIKLALVAIIDALGVYGVFSAWVAESWVIVAVTVVILIAVNVVYFSRRMLPLKYLLPGLIFLAIYQIFVIGYTGYASFTNYGDGHNSTQEDAISAILTKSQEADPDAGEYDIAILTKDGEYYFLAKDPRTDEVLVGTTDQPLAKATDVEEDSTGKPAGLPGYESVKLGQLAAVQGTIAEMKVPLSDDVNDGYLRTSNARTASVYRSTMEYDPAGQTMTDSTTGTSYIANDRGAFASESGKELEPGWKVGIGAENFTSIVTNDAVRTQFLQVLLWTFVFAILSVAGCYMVGLGLALTLNDWRMRGRRIYRSLLILPYAFPAFLAALVWRGMLNADYGFVNQVFLGGQAVQWLTDPWLARISVLVVNIWMGFPYMFLICTGAIQSLPDDVIEAAKVDGASPMRIFRSIKMPLLLVSTAPLLISSFAFNFNNFNLIYMLTGGGPKENALDAGGSTDILISYVYNIAFATGKADYGLACAVSILIFLIVGTVSAIGFKQTRVLEELN